MIKGMKISTLLIGLFLTIRNRKMLFIKTCSVCDSKYLKRICATDGTDYRATFECLKCGATGDVHEVWRNREST